MKRTVKSSLSVVARLDDLQRNLQILARSDTEEKFLEFVQRQENLRLQWSGAADECERLKGHNRNLEVRLDQARKQLDHEQMRAKKAEDLRRHSEEKLRRLEDVIEVLKDLVNNQDTGAISTHRPDAVAFLKSYRPGQSPMGTPGSAPRRVSIVSPGSGAKRRSSRGRSLNERSAGSILDSRELDDDEDEDDNDSSQLRRNNAQQVKTTSDSDIYVNGKVWKRSESGSRLLHHYETEGEVSAHMGSGIKTVIRSEERLHPTAPPMPVCDSSESDVNSAVSSNNNAKKRRSEDSDDSFLGVLNKRANVQYSPTLARTPSARLQRGHTWSNKKTIYFEKCCVCTKKFGFSNMNVKCDDCKSLAHEACKDQVSLPCLGVQSKSKTPSDHSGGVLSGAKLQDLCPSERPFIPPLVVQCIAEIERRGLTETGLYRVNGSDKQIKELYEKWMRGKSMPQLNLIDDVNVICGCLKLFLRNLRQPLVTYEQWPVLSAAVTSADPMGQTTQALHNLPLPHAHTLSFVLLHLQAVAAEASANHMTVDNLARVFAPTVVGNSGPALEPLQAINESDTQQMAEEEGIISALIENNAIGVKMMHLLLTLSGDVYSNLLMDEVAPAPVNRHMFESPQCAESASPSEWSTMLGPLSSARAGGRQEFRVRLPDAYTKRKFFPDPKI